MSRPYSNYLTYELAQLVRDKAQDANLLRTVEHELTFRRKRRARDLLVRVRELLTQLTVVAAATPAAAVGTRSKGDLGALLDKIIDNEEVEFWISYQQPGTSLVDTLAQIGIDLPQFPPSPLPDFIATQGGGPVDEGEFNDLVRARGIDVHRIAQGDEILVLGREDWSQEDVLEHIRMRLGQPLRIYSQEMFLAWMLAGVDPFSDPDILPHFAQGHPALEWLMTQPGFVWPTTFATPGVQPISNMGWTDLGMLKAYGYKVGASGLPSWKRQAILAKLYTDAPLRQVGPPGYMAQWGAPKSAQRLQKLANTIASLARNARRRISANMDQAIADWEDDLKWLKGRYYPGYAFAWPSTFVSN